MSFKENLISLRKATCKNAKEFAKLAGIIYTTYVSYEKGAWPNEENLVKIAAALNVSIDQLLNYSIDSARREANLAKWAGLDVKEENGLFSVVGLIPRDWNNLDHDEIKAAYERLNLSPLTAAEFDRAVKLARQWVIDENSTRFILWILREIDHQNYLKAQEEKEKKEPPAHE